MAWCLVLTACVPIPSCLLSGTYYVAASMIEYDWQAPKARPLAVRRDGNSKSTASWNPYDARLLQLSKDEEQRYVPPNTWSVPHHFVPAHRFWCDRGFSEALLMLDMNDLSKAEARGLFLDALIQDCGHCISQWWDKGLVDALKISNWVYDGGQGSFWRDAFMVYEEKCEPFEIDVAGHEMGVVVQCTNISDV